MSDLPKFFKRFRATRRRTLALVEGLSQTQIDFAPSKKKWSAGQVLDHLTRVDDVLGEELDELLDRWRRKPGSASLARTLSASGISLPLVPDALLPLFDLPVAMAGVFVPRPVRQALLSSRAIPVQAPARIAPRKGRSADELRHELAACVDRLEERIAANPEAEWRRMRYYHPLFGFTHLPGMIASLVAHEKRHQGQLRDILGARRFPTAG